MQQPFPPDIESRLATEFPAESLAAALNSLATYRGPERNRVIRCIVHLSAGDPKKIPHFVELAAVDYRDVIYWAEYDRSDRRVRSFDTPFS